MTLGPSGLDLEFLALLAKPATPESIKQVRDYVCELPVGEFASVLNSPELQYWIDTNHTLLASLHSIEVHPL